MISLVTFVPYPTVRIFLVLYLVAPYLECNTDVWSVTSGEIFRYKCAAEWTYSPAMSVGVELKVMHVRNLMKMICSPTVTKSF